ncbi:histidine triad nucleotide-binding protein [candidate division FCPU426 bacterium]|nr:histidine triad nucleotide-binding protein [candidate division FCPU426 bacterium]
MSDCLFCRIVNGEIPTKKVHEDERYLAFEDIHPQAPVHVLIVPKEHIASVAEVVEEQAELLGGLITIAARIARDKKLDSGYRLVFNCQKDAGQEVFHIHLHLLGGRKFTWPPG